MDSVSQRLADARQHLAAVEVERRALLIRLFADEDRVPLSVVQQLGYSGREAVAILRVERERAAGVSSPRRRGMYQLPPESTAIGETMPPFIVRDV